MTSPIAKKIDYSDFVSLMWHPEKLATPNDINLLINKIKKETIAAVLDEIDIFIKSDEREFNYARNQEGKRIKEAWIISARDRLVELRQLKEKIKAMAESHSNGSASEAICHKTVSTDPAETQKELTQ